MMVVVSGHWCLVSSYPSQHRHRCINEHVADSKGTELDLSVSIFDLCSPYDLSGPFWGGNSIILDTICIASHDN
jgi:hypothetical protein